MTVFFEAATLGGVLMSFLSIGIGNDQCFSILLLGSIEYQSHEMAESPIVQYAEVRRYLAHRNGQTL
jgi:hypothetical protein